MQKPRKPKRLPAIVPRFLKSAVVIGVIPALSSAGCPSPPVVAAYSRRPHPKKQQPIPIDAAESPPPVQPVVAMMMPSPVVAAVVPPPPAPADAGVDAPPAKKKPAKGAKQPPPAPPRPDIYGVAAMFAPAPNEELVPEDVGTPRKAKQP